MSKKNDTSNDAVKAHTGKEYMTAPITDALKEKAHEALVKARLRLLFKHPFFGNIALRLSLKAADRNWCPTAATDGRNFYYNPAFIVQLREGENVFLVGHELGHCIYEHFFRREDRDPKLWNIAGDYIINNTLDNEMVKKGGNYCEVITYLKPYLDHKYDGWTTEEIYDDLLEQQENGGKPENEGELLDVHIDASDGDEDGDSEGGADGLAPKPKAMDEDAQRELSNEIKDAIVQAANAVEAGDVPADMRRMIKGLLEPQMDWREIIRSQIESSIRSDFTFLRPNRKGWHMSAILPGMDRDTEISIALAIDTSGSISPRMLQEFVSEVAGIMDQYERYTIDIWQFDTRVYSYERFESNDGKDLRDYTIRGGGGTDFVPNWNFMEEQGIEPDQFIMFTDGYPCGSWGNEEYCDTVFLVHTNGSHGAKPQAPFGQTVYYDGVK